MKVLVVDKAGVVGEAPPSSIEKAFTKLKETFYCSFAAYFCRISFITLFWEYFHLEVVKLSIRQEQLLSILQEEFPGKDDIKLH